MSGINIYSFHSWILGVALVAISGIALAGSIADPDYATGETLTAAKMQNIKNAVNDNDTRINNLQTGAGTCAGNNASDEMVRVGSVCVDKNPASLWDGNTAGAAAVTAIPGGCTTTGSDCSGIFAQSRATPGTALKDGATISWARAARACANAGKRLVGPAEWMAAKSLGSVVLSGAGMFTDGNSEWVNIVTATGDPTGGSGNGTMGVGRMGPNIGGIGGTSGVGVVGFLATSVYTDLPGATVGFRCAR
jgi:hypothetical protein